MTKHKKGLRKHLPLILGALMLIATVVVIVHLISDMENKPAKKERRPQQITLTKPPPPPPPPPKVEKPPEPEANKVEEVQEEPEDLPDVSDEQPAGDLGLDAEGSAGSDGFGLAARKGGKGLLGDGNGGDPYAWYSTLIKNEVLEILSEKEDLRKKGYTAILKVWLEPNGVIKRFELARGSNDPEIDDLLNRLLSQLKKINEPLPPGMEQPVKLKITSRI